MVQTPHGEASGLDPEVLHAEDPRLAEQVATNYRTADISDAHRAMGDLAVDLTEAPARVGEDDIARLREHGFSLEAIWDVGATAALFNLSNRMAHLADMRPNGEFYELGRGQDTNDE